MALQEQKNRDLSLGLLFFGTICALVYATVALTGFSLAEKTVLHARFPNASGLKVGDAVLVGGYQSGSVASVSFLDGVPSDRRIAVDLEFDFPLEIRRDYRLLISEFTMLGGRVVELDPGSHDSPILPGETHLLGQVGPTAMASLGEFLNENSADVRAIVENLRAISDDLANGKGVLGSLVSDPQLRTDMASILSGVEQVVEDIRGGRGALGALVVDETTRERLIQMLQDGSAAMNDMRVITEDLAAGRGTFGALLVDEAMREDAVTLTENMRDAADRLAGMLADAAGGHGLLGRVLTDESLAEDGRRFLKDLADSVHEIRMGNGTVGKLVARDEAYDEMMRALRSVVRLLEDAREAQPISSFANMLFGATVGG